MALATWVRALIWKATDWRAALAKLCDDASALDTNELLDLARACELIEIDRRRALALYRAAWQRQPAQAALDRALAIARELGAFNDIAELALSAHEQYREPAHLLTAAFAFMDAGTPELAMEPLAGVLAARSNDDEAKSALASVRREIRDPQVEVSRWIAIASRGERDFARAAMHAARLARVAGLDAIHLRQLEQACLRGSREAASLIEIRLLERRRAEDLASFYRNRLDAITSEREWIDVIRAAVARMHLAGVQRGLALRLAQSGLAHVYRARLGDIPGHLALWDLLIHHARDARSTRELMPLVIEALEAPLSDDDRLYLARFGVEAANEARDPDAARPYAMIIDEIVPSGAPREPGTDDAVRVKFTTTQTELPVVKIRKPAAPSSAEPATAASAAAAPRKRPGVPSSPPLPANAKERAERVVVAVDVEVYTPSGSYFSAVVRDLSTTGLFIVTKRELAIDTVVELQLELPGANVLAVSRHRVDAKIVRRGDRGYGLVFVSPPQELVAAIVALAKPPDAP